MIWILGIAAVAIIAFLTVKAWLRAWSVEDCYYTRRRK